MFTIFYRIIYSIATAVCGTTNFGRSVRLKRIYGTNPPYYSAKSCASKTSVLRLVDPAIVGLTMQGVPWKARIIGIWYVEVDSMQKCSGLLRSGTGSDFVFRICKHQLRAAAKLDSEERNQLAQEYQEFNNNMKFVSFDNVQKNGLL